MGLKPYAFALPILRRCRESKLRIGAISNTGDDSETAVDSALRDAGLIEVFEPTLRIYSKEIGLTKDSPEIFLLAAGRAQVRPERCLFVGDDPSERTYAINAGFKVCPHPSLIEEVLGESHLRYLRVSAPAGVSTAAWKSELRGLPLVPLYISGKDGDIVYTIASMSSIPILINKQFGIQYLGGEDLPNTTDLYILRDDLASSTGFLRADGEAARFFNEGAAGIFVGTAPELASSLFPPGVGFSPIPCQGVGIVIALPPSRFLDEFHFNHTRHGHTLKLIPDPALLDDFSRRPGGSKTNYAMNAQPVLPEAVSREFGAISAQTITDVIARYSGAEATSPGSEDRILSRHIRHPHNARSVELLALELKAALGTDGIVRLHRFTQSGLVLYNIEGELPGNSEEAVLVTAHLDSTAMATKPYDESKDDAPGADDDASGIAAIITLAKAFSRLSKNGRLQRTVRFVLFNAEEEGLIGSRVYARQQRAGGSS